MPSSSLVMGRLAQEFQKIFFSEHRCRSRKSGLVRFSHFKKKPRNSATHSSPSVEQTTLENGIPLLCDIQSYIIQWYLRKKIVLKSSEGIGKVPILRWFCDLQLRA